MENNPLFMDAFMRHSSVENVKTFHTNILNLIIALATVSIYAFSNE